MAAARALYQARASEAELNLFGFGSDDYGEADYQDVWPCNWQAVRLFMALSTQWRVGMGGATGLDYTALAAAMDMLAVKRKKRAALFGQIGLMEAEVLNMWAEKGE